MLLAYQMAIEGKNVVAEAIEAMAFSEIAQKYRVRGVPHTTINEGKGNIVGVVQEGNLMAEIQRVINKEN